MKKIGEVSFDTLFQNCIYSSIAHAVFVLDAPFFDYLQSWDGLNCSFIFHNTRGTISFYPEDQIVVGAARNEGSKRRSLYPNYDANELFSEAPEIVQEKARVDALEYLYDEAEGIVKPMATLGFWIENSIVYSKDDSEEFLNNGGEFFLIVSRSLMDVKDFCLEEYAFSDLEIDLVDYIYECYTEQKPMDNRRVASLVNESCSGYKQCVESLAEIGISL